MRARYAEGALASALHLIRPRRAVDMMPSAGRVPRGFRAEETRRIALRQTFAENLPYTHTYVTLGNTFLPKRAEERVTKEIYCSRLNCAT